ncbi:unnamed protein product, partial [Clonostachys byssicola]
MASVNPFVATFDQDTLQNAWNAIDAGDISEGKVYWKLEAVISAAQKQQRTSTNGDADHDEESRPKDTLLEHLKEFLDWGDSVDLSRFLILSEAVKEYQKSLSRNDPSKKRSKPLPGSGTPRSAPSARDQKEEDGDQSNGSGKIRQDHPAYNIALAMCQVDPTLPFTSSKEPTLSSISSKEEEMPPFHIAADAGLTPFVQIMLRGLGNDQESITEHVSRKYQGKTALRRAATSPHLDVLMLFRDKYANLIDIESIIFTIQKTGPKDEGKADAFLKAFELLAQAKCVFKPEGTPYDDKIWKSATEVGSAKVLKCLLQSDWHDKFATYKNARLVIESGDLSLWKLFSKDTRKTFMRNSKCDFLHVAVQNRRQDMVADLLKEFPEQVVVKAPKYPLEHLSTKDSSKDDVAFSTIRNDLMAAMIYDRDLSIQHIRKILKDSKRKGMCLHLTSMDTSERNFFDYVQFLISSEKMQRPFFKFESVLKYAAFPNLRTPSCPNNALPLKSKHLDHKEIQDVYEWLRRRNVTKVMEVSVPDRLDDPHSDDVVAECINGWDTRILKWKKLDLYLGNLYKGDEDKLEELELYSSGNRSVHDQWYQQLERFKKDVMSDARVELVKKELEDRLAQVKERLVEKKKKRSEEQQEKPSEEQDDDPDDQPFTLDSCLWDSNLSYAVPTNLEDIAVQTAWPTLDAFTQAFKSYPGSNKARKTKVAIIDSGVVVYGGLSEINSSSSASPGQDLAHRIVDGVSLVSSGNSEEPFWHATDPHGTQMAKLISSINPLCELYVIKVTETRTAGVSANNVAASTNAHHHQAIEWAREKKVDIISLSLVVYQDSDQNLAHQINLAKDEDIVILSSTADGGMRKENTTTSADKSAHIEVINIGASDWNGNLLNESQKAGYDYCMVGQNVPVGLVPFLKSREVVTGSSVATALAAGLAALIVACCRISTNCNTECDATNCTTECEATNCTTKGYVTNCNTKGYAKWRYRMVMATMKRMSVGETPPKWVDLDNFC